MPANAAELSSDPEQGLVPRRQWWLPVTLLALAGVTYLWLCTDRSWRIFAPQDFGDIFDHLAISIVHGRLDLPPAVIGAEAFIIDGKYYGYWAPFPALLRIPLALTGSDFWVGHTARLMCWLAAMVSVYSAWKILDELRQLFRWARPNASFISWYLAALAFGAHLPYLVAGPSVYHESVLWGSALALAALQLGLGFLRTKRVVRLTGAVLLAGASALTRPTSGHGALIGTAGLIALLGWEAWRSQPGRARSQAIRSAVLLTGLTAILFSLPFLYNYVRFGSFIRLPYDKHPQVAAWRLEITKQGNFKAVNVVPNALTYFDPAQIDIRRGFPYFHLAAYSPRPPARIEHGEAYAGIPAFMTGLCILALLSYHGFGRDRRVLLLLLGGSATLAALLSFTAIAHRYEHDLFALTVLTSGAGALWLGQRSGAAAHWARVAVGLLLALGIWQSMAFAYYEQEWGRWWLTHSSQPAAMTPAH